MLHQMENECGHTYGLYHDDGLGIIKATARKTENIKKRLCKVFAIEELKLAIESNKKIVDFLDITLN